ncbi:MAG: ABC transporter ATP-binding protein [Alphaproteobacteria bacterium]|nr:ABC transporter ATP-binding protein [Alphaproteobacteria bacterium]
MVDLLNVRDLEVAFDLIGGRMTAVNKVSFRIPHGRTVALVGESGSGKSVISQAIMGILPKTARILGGSIAYAERPDAGSPVVDIAALAPSSPEMRAIRGGEISIIFQEPMTSLSSLHTIGDQICEALHLHRDVSTEEGRELAAAMLGRVGFPDPHKALKIYPFELSGGLRQRAMIAMALICHPALLIADEPTTALDVTIQAQILKLIKDLQAELGMAVLIITHDLGVVANMADEVVVLYRGEVMEKGTLTDIFSAPGHAYLKGLLHAVPRFNMAEGERLTPLREISHSTSTYFSTAREREGERVSDTPLLRAQNISKSFNIRSSGLFAKVSASGQGVVKAVDDVSLDIGHQECVGLVGESGCGKTTLSKILLGALTPDTGTVTFDDDGHLTDVHALPAERRLSFRRKAQFVFQDPFGSLNPRMTVADIVAEPLVIHGIGDYASRVATVRECLDLVGLDVKAMARYPHSFSGGQRQRIGIARALALKPDLLILDEPVSALDVSIQAQVLNLLTDLRNELGLTYLFISHNLAVVNYMAGRIIVMCAGRIVEAADKATLFARPIHPYTQALLAAVPEPDLEHPLDLHALMEGRCSDPSAWPAPFTIDGDIRPQLIDVGNGHFVRRSQPADATAVPA